MRQGLSIGVVALGLAVIGCSGEEGVRCDDPGLYQSSTAVGPIRVPDDLTVPDESQSLLIPGPSSGQREAPPTEGCIESPPPYSQNANSD
jgi:hypothetical protein